MVHCVYTNMFSYKSGVSEAHWILRCLNILCIRSTNHTTGWAVTRIIFLIFITRVSVQGLIWKSGHFKLPAPPSYKDFLDPCSSVSLFFLNFNFFPTSESVLMKMMKIAYSIALYGDF